MDASEKSKAIDQAITDMFGFDRVEVIQSNQCVPPPIGCGKPALHFRDAISEDEFSISGLCQECQDQVFADEPEQPEESPFMNEKPFEYTSHFGTKFNATRCDFFNGVTVSDKNPNNDKYTSDVAEMIGYHATNIHPQLNGFQGYDCIYWTFQK